MHTALLSTGLLCAVGAAQSAATTTAIELVGSVAYEAHLARPHATYDLPASVRVFCERDRVRIELRESAPGRDAPELTTWLRDGDGRCWVRGDGGQRFARGGIADARFVQLLHDAVTDAAHGDHEIAFQHPRLGDVADRARWTKVDTQSALQLTWHRTTDQVEFALHRTDRAPTCDPAPAFEPGEVDPHDAAAGVTAPAPARFKTLATGVHEITLPTADTRALAIEFADHVVLCETSLDNAAGEQLLASLDEHLPGKPVRYVLFGHYHPHYTGGLRPVMARGATVVAPPLGAAFAKEIAARPFRSPPDALAASGRTPTIESFTGERSFHDDTNELVAIDIGALSHHTDEYVVFWLPRQQILFEGDLGWFGGADGPRASVRARGLLQAIDDRHLPVATLVQSWPTVGLSLLSMAEFRALLAK